MRSEWVGGGINELLQDDIWELRRTIMFGAVGIPLLLPYNLLIMSIVAVVPSFEQWYTRYLGFQQMQTHERVFRGLCFIPAFKYAMCARLIPNFARAHATITTPRTRWTRWLMPCPSPPPVRSGACSRTAHGRLPPEFLIRTFLIRTSCRLRCAQEHDR